MDTNDIFYEADALSFTPKCLENILGEMTGITRWEEVSIELKEGIMSKVSSGRCLSEDLVPLLDENLVVTSLLY